MTARIGSLFAGYGGLELGIAATLNAEPAWFSEIDPAPSRVLAHHWPDVPNHGDITVINWSSVEPVDVLCGGFPCQDVSLAGLRRGLHPDTRSGLWSHFALAIAALRPRLVIVENVRGLLSAEAHSDMEPNPWTLGDRRSRPALRALGAVLGDLADLGYDAQCRGVRAADAGAPHGRFRVFLAACPADPDRQRHGRREDPRMVGRLDRDDAGEAWERERTRPIPGDRNAAAAEDADGAARDERRGTAPGHPEGGRTWADARGRGGASAPDANGTGFGSIRGLEAVPRHADRRDSPDTAWGAYEPAIRRWEHTTGNPAPAPTEAGRLSPRFVEWMMGLPAGHVTDPAIGLTRAAQLKALGNGVVPQQAALALGALVPDGALF